MAAARLIDGYPFIADLAELRGRGVKLQFTE
jgi:hypothetical protein